MKILLVDDEQPILTAQSAILRLWGYQVEVASDGDSAWKKVSDPSINLVISDWMMPGMTGIELCRKIRESKFGHYIYFLLCTAKTRREDIVEGLAAGADDFLMKPIDHDELKVRLLSGQRVLDLVKKLEDKNRQLQRAKFQIENQLHKISRDLDSAAELQTNLLPPVSPCAGGVKAEWIFAPSHYVAGDIFNFFPIDENHVGFYTLDVSGHGVPSAILSSTLSMVLRPETRSENLLKSFHTLTGMQEPTSPEKVLSELNRRFELKEDRYFTMTYGLYKQTTSTLRISLAGQPPPLLLKPSGEVKKIGEGGFPLGIWPKAVFDCIEVQTASEDRLFLYSDGISECSNTEGEQFGEERIIRYLQEQGPSHTLKELMEGLKERIYSWNKEQDRFEDDVSMLALEFS